jgi:hypothetical protein
MKRKYPHNQLNKRSAPRPKPPRRRPTHSRRRRKLVQPMTTGNAYLDAWLLTARPLAEQFELLDLEQLELLELPEFVWPDDMGDKP